MPSLLHLHHTTQVWVVPWLTGAARPAHAPGVLWVLPSAPFLSTVSPRHPSNTTPPPNLLTRPLGLCDIDLSDLDALLENPPPPPPPPHGAAALQPAGPPPPADGPAAVAPAANGVPHHQPFPAHAAGEFHLANVNGAAEPDSGPLAVLVSGLGGAGRLRELLLDGCCLRRLPASFSQLTALSHLSLMENYDSVVRGALMLCVMVRTSANMHLLLPTTCCPQLSP